MSKGKSFGTSFVAGVVLLPAAAILSVALIGQAAPEEPVEAALVADTTVAAVVVQAEAPASPFLSDLDIWTACVPDAAGLIEKETAGTITPVEDAALDALRAICAEEGIPLDGPPPPPPVSRTVYVNGPSAAPAPAAPPATVAVSTDTTEPPTDSTTATSTTLPPVGTTPTTTAATTAAAGETQYLDARAAALSAIDEAVAANGKADKISEARQQLAEAESKAANTDYWGALEKALEAERNAQEAISEAGD